MRDSGLRWRGLMLQMGSRNTPNDQPACQNSKVASSSAIADILSARAPQREQTSKFSHSATDRAAHAGGQDVRDPLRISFRPVGNRYGRLRFPGGIVKETFSNRSISRGRGVLPGAGLPVIAGALFW